MHTAKHDWGIAPFKMPQMRWKAPALRCFQARVRSDSGYEKNLHTPTDSTCLLQIKHSFHLRLHRGIHLDKRRLGTFKTFARKLLRRVDPEFAADGDFAPQRRPVPSSPAP